MNAIDHDTSGSDTDGRDTSGRDIDREPTSADGERNVADRAGDGPDRLPPAALAERVTFAVRQAAVIGVCLLIGGGLVGALRPSEASTRDITSSPFLWAAVLWAVVLLLDAVVFDHSQIRRLEREPMALAVATAAITFVVGLISFDAGSVGARIVYLAANALGALVFWWAIFSLVWLLTRWARSANQSA